MSTPWLLAKQTVHLWKTQGNSRKLGRGWGMCQYLYQIRKENILKTMLQCKASLHWAFKWDLFLTVDVLYSVPTAVSQATIWCRDQRQQADVGCNGWEQRKETHKESRKSRWLDCFCINKVRHTRVCRLGISSKQTWGRGGTQGVNRASPCALSSFAEWVCSGETVHRFWVFENPQKCLPAISCLPWCCVYLNCLFGLCFVCFLWFAPGPPTEISWLLSPKDK